MAQKRVIIYDLGESFGMLPDNLIKRIEFLQNLLEEIPKECRNTASVYMEATESGDGWPFIEYRISYWRPENQEELDEAARLKHDHKRVQVSSDKEMLEALMKKYPVAVQINLKKEK